MSNKLLPFIVLLLIFVLIANLVLFALKIVTAALFWGLIIGAAIFAHQVLPN